MLAKVRSAAACPTKHLRRLSGVLSQPAPYTDYLLRLRSRAGLGLNTRDRPGVESCPEGHTETSLALQHRAWRPQDFPSARDDLEFGHAARQRRAGIPAQGKRSAALGKPPIIPTRPAKGGSIFLGPKGNAHQMPSRSASTKGDVRPCRALARLLGAPSRRPVNLPKLASARAMVAHERLFLLEPQARNSRRSFPCHHRAG